MSTSDSEIDPVAALRAKLALQDFDPAANLVEGARLLDVTRESVFGDSEPKRRTEVFVRFAGVGVKNHRVPVHDATELLEVIQGTVTAIGSAHLRLPNRGKPMRGKHAVGVRAATELLMTPDVSPGSLVFRLEANDADDTLATATQMLAGTDAVDSLVDEALSELLDLIESAESADPGEIEAIAERMRPFGSIAASKLSKFSESAQRSNVEVDLRLWSRSGRRRGAVLRARGAGVLRAAAEMNKESTSPHEFEGVLRTISDGGDRWRLELATGKDLKLSVADDFDVAKVGALLLKRVTAQVQVTTKWNLASGKEKREYRLLAVQVAESPDPSTPSGK
ncbi:MAG: hypothetical protein HGA51_06225 [Demequinaceae bacterium]|nr:hypothetical protein [Demequinaceae bacterium]